jgi:hypothetical protein
VIVPLTPNVPSDRNAQVPVVTAEAPMSVNPTRSQVPMSDVLGAVLSVLHDAPRSGARRLTKSPVVCNPIGERRGHVPPFCGLRPNESRFRLRAIRPNQ